MYYGFFATKYIKPQNKQLGSNEVRINLIYNGLEILKNNWLLGIGSGNMTYYIENYGKYPTKDISSMHNYWMEILIDYGIIIFSIFVLQYIKLIIHLFRQYNNNKHKNIIIASMIFIFFLSAFIVASISSSNNLTKEWLWILVGIVFAFANINIKDGRRDD